MSFGTDLNTVIQNDASLNDWCDGGIYFENLPDNFDLTKTWLVYSFRKSEQSNCLNSKKAYLTYQITVKIVTNDTIKNENVSDYLLTLFNGNDTGDIIDTWFTADSHSIDLEKGVYMNSLDFESYYP